MQRLSAAASSHAYVRVLRRWWWLPVVFMILSGGLTYVGTEMFIPKDYGSSVLIQIQPTTVGTVSAGIMDANTAAIDITSGSMIAAAQSAVSHCAPVNDPKCAALLDWKALHRRLTCSADATDRFVTCATTSRNYLVPPSVLNIVAYLFPAWNRSRIERAFNRSAGGRNGPLAIERSDLATIQNDKRKQSLFPPGSTQYQNLSNEIFQLRLAVSGLEQTISTQQLQDTQAEGYVQVISAAKPVTAPVSPHPLRNALLGGIIGIGLAAALIVLLEYLDDTFRSTDEIVEYTNLPLLGAVRKYDGTPDEMATVAARMPRTAIAEAYRVARANIQFTEIGGDLKVVLVTSARDGEGKTTTANNLATTFALAGNRVLLVDADLRRPGLTKIMGLRESHGLSSVLLDPDADVARATEVPGLSIVPSGAVPPNPSELLGSSRMRTFIETAAKNFDLVILDTPPVLSVADTRIMATLADGVILVLDPAITTRRMIRQARIAIENVGSRLLGVMLNRDIMRGEGYYYNYYYYEHRRERNRDRSVR